MSTSDDSDKERSDLNERIKTLRDRLSMNPDNSRVAAERRIEDELEKEKDGRKEDRFLFVLALLIIFDVWALKDVASWTLPIVVGILELFGLLVMARRNGVEEIHVILSQLLPTFRLRAKPMENNPESDRKPDNGKDNTGQ